MMKKEMLFAVLVAGFVTNGVLVHAKSECITLPSKDVLKNRLHENGFDYFDEKMKLADTLANKKTTTLGVSLALNFAVYDFCKEYPEDVCVTAHMSQDDILKVLLQDYPEVIDELKESLRLE